MLCASNKLEWLYLSHSSHRNILPYQQAVAELCAKAQERALERVGQDLLSITMPFSRAEFQHLLSVPLRFQVALADFVGQVDFHLPKDPHLTLLQSIPVRLMPMRYLVPLKGDPTVFSDGGRK